MKVTLKKVTPNAEVNVVEIARVSSARKDKSEKPEGLISYLIKNKHWSPFEHSYMTIEIITSKAIGIQLLRHRSFTFQEFSQRYAKVEEFEPIELRKQADKNRQSSTDFICSIDINSYKYILNEKCKEYQDIVDAYIKALELCQTAYLKALNAGIARECARFILPMTTQTTLYMTGSIRSWIHMLDLRDDSHAQKEIQLVAKEIKKIFIEQFPIISKALNWI